MSQGSVEPRARGSRPIDPGVSIGHVHLRTADIDRTRWFYVDVLGFDVVNESRGVPGWGTTGDTLFVSAGATTTISRSTRGSRRAAGRSRTASRACTTSPSATRPARRWPTRCGAAEIDWPIRQATDHGTHEAVYTADPDGNGVELMWDRPPHEWPRDEDGHLAGGGDDLDLDALAA
jgi:catechol 2,3-dioxygenase